MKLIKFFLIVFVLVFSGQSLALFMPAGFQVTTETVVVSSDGGC